MPDRQRPTLPRAHTAQPDLRRVVQSLRGDRQPVDPRHANAVWMEAEASCPAGDPVPTATVLLAASECPWRCAMCDLWKGTLTRPTQPGDLVHQLDVAMSRIPDDVRVIKLYNAGNFFDRHSVPACDHAAIAARCERFDRVIIENHPRLTSEAVVEFAKRLRGRLEVAMGLESVQPGMLRRLNKGMTRDDFDRACDRLVQAGIDVRAFILLRPPWTADVEAVYWAILSLRHAFRKGVRHASVIPVRAGNGFLDQLQREGQFAPPSIAAVETTLQVAATIRPRGVLAIDLWDWQPAGACEACFQTRRGRIHDFNVTQRLGEPVDCDACQPVGAEGCLSPSSMS